MVLERYVVFLVGAPAYPCPACVGVMMGLKQCQRCAGLGQIPGGHVIVGAFADLAEARMQARAVHAIVREIAHVELWDWDRATPILLLCHEPDRLLSLEEIQDAVLKHVCPTE